MGMEEMCSGYRETNVCDRYIYIYMYIYAYMDIHIYIRMHIHIYVDYCLMAVVGNNRSRGH